jgi:hypothetical protein
MSDNQQGTAPRLVPDKVMAPQIGLSVAYLQKDRRTERRIPFVRIGNRCLYDPAEVFQAIQSYRVGGPGHMRRRAKGSA